MSEQEIATCEACPLAVWTRRGDGVLDEPEWCDAVGVDTQCNVGLVPPPAWCPLRKQAHTIRLQRR